jgi:hypothetical protein
MIAIAIIFRPDTISISITQSIIRAGQPYCEFNILRHRSIKTVQAPILRTWRFRYTLDNRLTDHERMPEQENSFMCACAQKP